MMPLQSHLEGGLIKGNDGGTELQEVGSPPHPVHLPQTGQLLAIKGARPKSIIDTHPL